MINCEALHKYYLGNPVQMLLYTMKTTQESLKYFPKSVDCLVILMGAVAL